MVATLNWKFNRDLESASRRADSLEFERASESRAARVFSYSADMRRAYVTCSGSGKLVELDWARPGLKLLQQR